jgi:hypothetical protein
VAGVAVTVAWDLLRLVRVHTPIKVVAHSLDQLFDVHLARGIVGTIASHAPIV